MRLGLAAAVCGLFLLAGCSGGAFKESNQTVTTTSAGAALSGRVYGGQAPVVGAKVYLYAANTTGYGSPSISLLTSAMGNPPDGNGHYYVTTDSKGAWGINGDYTCPSTASQVYLYAVGGDPGGGANSAAGLLTALGTCPANSTFSPSLYVVINEVSTIAAAYTFAGFAVDATHVGSSGTPLALTGIANAFANAANFENISTGNIYYTIPAGTGGVFGAKVNTLANILAACVNSTGPSSSACITLFANTTYNSVVPAETATAAINMAHSTYSNISALYALSIASPPFLPELTGQPAEFSLSIAFSGNGISGPGAVVIDGSGDAWIGNVTGAVVELSSSGTILSGASGFAGPVPPGGGAIDGSGDGWISDPNGNDVVKLSGTGSVLSGANGFTGGGLNGPTGLAIDGSGDAWITNTGGNSITEMSSNGSILSGSGYTAAGTLNQPYYIAIDGAGSAWIVNSGGPDSVTKLSSSGAVLSGASGYTPGGLIGSSGIAIDSHGNVWIPNPTSNSVSEISNTGVTLSGSLGYFGATNQPVAIAIDGSDNAWVLDSSHVVELSQAGSYIGDFRANLSAPNGIAIDGSGNVWIADSGTNYVVEIVGVASPVITPIAAGLPATPTSDGSSNLGTKP